MSHHEKINYIEFPAKDLAATKAFFSTVFGWEFIDYGPTYTAFLNAGINGGFFASNLKSSTDTGSVLIVFYSKTILETREKIKAAGGKIVKALFSFPGGCRFHFSDPNGNEFAVWSDVVNPEVDV